MKSTKHSMLELLILAVRWCSLPLPLSAVEGYAASAYYHGTTVPIITTCWCGYSNWYSSKNSRTGYLHSLAVGGTTTFAAVIGKTISHLNWILDRVKRNCDSEDPGIWLKVLGDKTSRRDSTGPASRVSENSFRSVI